MGRSSTFAEEIASEICSRLAEGETLRSICRDDRMPHFNTVYDWVEADASFAVRIARARATGHEAIAESCIDIADGGTEDPARDKLRVWTRMQLLSKWSPKRYGEAKRVALTDADGNSLPPPVFNIGFDSAPGDGPDAS